MSSSPGGYLKTFTIYRRPSDYSNVPFVVRASTVTLGEVIPDAEPLGFADTLDQARGLIPPEADAMFPRGDGDPPTIVETWM